jgi:hypothetical protein
MYKLNPSIRAICPGVTPKPQCGLFMYETTSKVLTNMVKSKQC